MDAEHLKIEVARRALDHVEHGMRLGIGTGSTANAFIRLLAEKVADGLEVTGVATSQRTQSLCAELGIALSTLDETPELDLTIDGADEIGPDLTLIKGGGGALLREKIVASASRRMIAIADESKVVDLLGRFPLPIEVNAFGIEATTRAIDGVAGELGLHGPLKRRVTRDGPFVTDGGHFIIDASFGRIPDPRALANALNAIPGVVEQGLFVDLATMAIVAGPEGIRTLTSSRE